MSDKTSNNIKTQNNDTNSENNLTPEVIRSEVNLLVLPFFALWDKGLKKKNKN